MPPLLLLPFLLRHCISYFFFVAVIEHMSRSNLRESWFWLRFQGERLLVVGRRGGRGKELRDHSDLGVR